MARFITGEPGNAEMIDEPFGLTVGEVRWAAEEDNCSVARRHHAAARTIGLENRIRQADG